MSLSCPCAGYYLTGDNARRDKDGYYWITGRADDVVIVSGAHERRRVHVMMMERWICMYINDGPQKLSCMWTGHNLGTAEVEAALTEHPAVAEAAVVGIPHDVKGSCLYCFVTLKQGHEGSDALAKELKTIVRAHRLAVLCVLIYV